MVVVLWTYGSPYDVGSMTDVESSLHSEEENLAVSS